MYFKSLRYKYIFLRKINLNLLMHFKCIAGDLLFASKIFCYEFIIPVKADLYLFNYSEYQIQRIESVGMYSVISYNCDTVICNIYCMQIYKSHYSMLFFFSDHFITC